MKKIVSTITRYDAGDGFFIDIEESLSALEAWIWTQEYEVKWQMAYIMKNRGMDYDDFVKVVEANLSQYKEQYWKEVEYL